MSMNTVRVKYEEVIPAHRLPPGCHLAKMLERLALIAKESEPVYQKFNSLRGELAQLDAILAEATLDTITPERFAVESARRVLLEREVEKAERAARNMTAAHEAARVSFDAEHARYKQLVGQLRSVKELPPTNDWQYSYLDAEQRARPAGERNWCIQQIEGFIGVSE